MNVLDAIILIPLIFGAYKGFRKGLLMELVSIIALVLAIIVSFRFMQKGIEFLMPHLGAENSMLPVFAFIMIFMGVLVGVFYTGKILKKILNFTPLGWIDDVAGGVLGLLKWSLVLSTLLWLFDKGGIILPDDLTSESLLFPYLVLYAPKLLEFVANVFPVTTDLVSDISAILERFSR